MKPRLKFFGFLAALCLLFWRWLDSYPIPLREAWGWLRSFAALLLLLGLCLGLGRSLLSRFKVFCHSLSEEAMYSFGLGLGLLALLAQGLSLAGGLYSWVCWTLASGMLLVTFEHLEHFWRELRMSLRSKHPWEGSTSEMLIVLPAALSLACLLVLALAPVSFYDALVYHLALPQRAAATGRLLPQEGMLYSWLPGLMEGAWSLCISLDSERLAALLNLMLAAFLGLGVMDLGARLLPVRRLWLPPALLFTQPAFLFAFGVFGSDGGAAFYTFLSLSAFLSSLGSRNQRLNSGWSLLAFLLAGLAGAAKPVALLHGAALLLLFAVRATLDPLERRPGLLASCLALFLLPLLPSMARNFVASGNPFAPFGLSLFSTEIFAPASRSYLEHLKGYGADSPWWKLVWDLVFNAKEGAFGGGSSLSFLLLAGLGVAAMEHPREIRWLGAHAAVGLLLFSMGPRVLRYVLIFVPGAVVLASFALVEAEQWARSRSWALVLRLFLVLAFFAGSARFLLAVVRDFDPFKVVLGRESREDYLERRGVGYIRAANWLKDKAPGASVLALYEARSAYLPPKTLAVTAFEKHPFTRWLERAATPQELDAIVLKNGYDFVLINRPEGRRLQASGTPMAYFSTPEKELLFNTWIHAHAPAARALEGEGVLLFPLR